MSPLANGNRGEQDSRETRPPFVNHVHADAAPGDLGDFFCGGEPRLQDELQHLAVAGRCIGVQQAAQNGFAAHSFKWHTSANTSGKMAGRRQSLK